MPVRLFIIAIFFISSCKQPDSQGIDLNNIAGNQEVADFMHAFKARGDSADNSIPTKPQVALSGFKLPPDLAIDLVLSEPKIHQPLELNFDHRGRLWVVQYNQYPYPKGLQVTSIDNHLRVKFDKVPKPPPQGISGADKITFFEDTNGDGVFDKSTDAITGLNIATGVEFGRGNIWVLNPPYLLAYPDTSGDGLPDGPPVVHLNGFGLEDTHAVVNSLRWGMDGWLYGATGSTTTADISSSVTKNVKFQGQGIWRYHPETEIFELFAEGGGNTFHVEIDSEGRTFSGDNGTSRGQYYKQGAYYTKNWGKHGPLTNPYAFGYLKNMINEGEALRFTHAWIKYQAGALPEAYENKVIAINPLLSYLQLTSLITTGSTFKTTDHEKIVETDDHWFRPVDIKVGPDGAVYLADWYDSRLTHVDPTDDWHKSSGRIYRIRGKNFDPVPSFDLSQYTSEQLLQLLSHRNKWFRNQALRQLGDRKDRDVVDQLKNMLVTDTGQLALEALWALNVSGYFDNEVAKTALTHNNPMVRLWSVRLLGDKGTVPPEIYNKLLEMTRNEVHPEVHSQIACTAKRLPAIQSILLIESLIGHPNLASDPDNPLLVWWAIEAAAESSPSQIVEMFREADLWTTPVVKETILSRLAQKLAMMASGESLDNCTLLLSMAPDAASARPVLDGIQEGLVGKDLNSLPEPLITLMSTYLSDYGEAPLALLIQKKDNEAIQSALDIIQDSKAVTGDRLVYLKLMGEEQITEAISVLLRLAQNSNERTSVRKIAIEALTYFSSDEIGKEIAVAYPDKLRADPVLRAAAFDLFSVRSSWALSFLKLIEITRQVQPSDVPVQVIRQFQLLEDNQVDRQVTRIWPNIEADLTDKQFTANRITKAVNSGTADINAGRLLYLQNCGSCHKLYREGGDTGPDLTGYDRSNLSYLITNIVDPNIDIREGYVNYMVTTLDNRMLVGTLINRSTEVLELKTLSGSEYTIPTNQIKVMEAQTASLMPERLVDHLSDAQLRDLFGYLMQDRNNL